MKQKKYSADRSGFSLIEVVASLGIVATLVVGLIPIASSALNMQQREITLGRLNELRRAVNGNPAIVVDEARTAFGYIGDMGNLPTNLEDLWIKGSQPSFVFDTTKKTGAGWNGPYLELNVTSYAAALGFDAWGAAFDYSTVAFVDSDLGADALGKLASFGPDMSAGGDDDLTVHFFDAEAVSRVQGFIVDDDGNAVPGANVTVNYPQSGSLTSESDSADAFGYYSFTDIPFGNRTLTIEPRLVLAPGTAIADNNKFEFTIKNFSSDEISITSIQVEFTIVPAAYFKILKVDGDTVYDSDSPRFGDGDSTAFSSQTIAGTGGVAESFPIAVQSPVTQVADLIVGNVGVGGSILIEMEEFQDVSSGSGNDVDISGVTFEVTFSDGSIVVVTPVSI